MISIKNSFIYPFLIYIFLLGDVVANDSWELKKDSNNIQVYVRNTPNSRLNSFRGTTLISARISSIVALLKDKKNYSKWVYNCQSAKSLGENKELSAYSYTITKTPWPFRSRDSIVYSVLKQNKKTKEVIISLIAKPDYFPLQNGLVRIQQLKGRWILTPQKKGMIKVTTEIMVDPGGRLPKWLVNQFAINTPFNTLLGLRKIVNSHAYKNIKLNYIID